MRSEKFEFQGHDGPLAARLDMPARDPKACAVFAHCFTCSKDFLAAKRVSQRLASLGIAVLRFDFTGLGHSDGEFANTNFSTNVQDLIKAAKAVGARFGAGPELLVGHSLGGAAVLAAAGELSAVKAVAVIGAPADPAHVAHNFGCKLDEIEASGKAEVSLAGRPFTIKKQFLEDIAAQSLERRVGDLKKALLVLHAPLDETVGIENASTIFTAAKHPKSFVSLDDADHLLTRAKDADYAAQVIAAWAMRYLGISDDGAASPDEGVRVSEADAEGFLHDIYYPRGRSGLADEPKRVGGTDLGPGPFELVAAGLGACTSMTMRLYARRKGWDYAGLTVDVTLDQKDRHTTTFRREIRIEGDLSEEQRARLIEIANKCPVHRMLEGEVEIETVAV